MEAFALRGAACCAVSDRNSTRRSRLSGVRRQEGGEGCQMKTAQVVALARTRETGGGGGSERAGERAPGAMTRRFACRCFCWLSVRRGREGGRVCFAFFCDVWVRQEREEGDNYRNLQQRQQQRPLRHNSTVAPVVRQHSDIRSGIRSARVEYQS